MTVTQFEAALIYDQHYHNSSDFSVPVLVIDVDELEAGICRYGKWDAYTGGLH